MFDPPFGWSKWHLPGRLTNHHRHELLCASTSLQGESPCRSASRVSQRPQDAKGISWVFGETQSLSKTTSTAKSGKTQTIFIEGITTDPQGNLFVVDIPNGQVLCFNLATKDFKVVKRWEGEPNGLCVRADGKLVIADHLEGVVRSNACIICSQCSFQLIAPPGSTRRHFDNTAWSTQFGAVQRAERPNSRFQGQRM